MKKYILSLIFLSFLLSFKSASDYEIKNEKKLIEFLGEKDFEYLKFKNNRLLIYYDFFIDNSWYLIDVPSEKINDLSYSEIELPLINGKIDKGNLNVLMLDVSRDYEHEVRYFVKGSNQVIAFYSEKKFIEMFNELKLNNDEK